MRRRLSSLILLAFLAFPGAPLHAATSPKAAVAERAERLYGLLLEKNARHFRIRDDLKPFFANDEELSAFLVRLARDLDDKGIRSSKLEERHVEVVETDTEYGVAETRTEIEGDWILWFNRSLTRVDKWKLVDGQWYVNPPPLKNLDYDSE